MQYTYAIVTGLMTFACVLRWLTWRTGDVHETTKWTLLLTAAIALTGIMLATINARSEMCYVKPDPEIRPQPGYSWRWRYISGDDRKCWYLATSVLPKDKLVWDDLTVPGKPVVAWPDPPGR